MATTQTFEAIIRLNTQETKNEMDALQKKVDDLKKKKADALKDPTTSVTHLSCRPRYRNGCAILQLLRGRQAISQANRHPDHIVDAAQMVGHGFAASARPPAPEARR